MQSQKSYATMNSELPLSSHGNSGKKEVTSMWRGQHSAARPGLNEENLESES